MTDMERHRQQATSTSRQAGSEVLAFSDQHLDTANACLRRGGKSIRLQRSTCALLKYLAARPGQLVSRDELHQSLWPNVVVGAGALNFQVRRARHALGDNARRPRFIETVHRVGYRFLPRVQALPERHATPETPSNLHRDSPSALFVGREQELAQMGRAWQFARTGRRAVISIEGEMGIGKSSLVSEFLTGVEDAVIVRGRCIEHYASAEPYGPVLSALEQLDDAQSKLWASALVKTGHNWQARLPMRFGGGGSPPAPAHHPGMIREMQRAVEELTHERPLILIIEDVQWADAATCDLLRSLAHSERGAKLLLLATSRPSELAQPGPRLPSLFGHLERSAAVAGINLDGLSPDDVEQYLERRIRPDALPRHRVAAIHGRTGGNPLFLKHLVQELLHKVLPTVEGPEDTDDTWMPLPQAVVALIGPELQREEEPRLKILQAASIVGRRFDSESVAAAVQLETTEVERQCLSWARRGRYLRRLSTPRLDGRAARSASFEFIHDLCRQLIVREMGPAWRRKLGRRLGERQSRLRASLTSARPRGLRTVSS